MHILERVQSIYCSVCQLWNNMHVRLYLILQANKMIYIAILRYLPNIGTNSNDFWSMHCNFLAWLNLEYRRKFVRARLRLMFIVIESFTDSNMQQKISCTLYIKKTDINVLYICIVSVCIRKCLKNTLQILLHISMSLCFILHDKNVDLFLFFVNVICVATPIGKWYGVELCDTVIWVITVFEWFR